MRTGLGQVQSSVPSVVVPQSTGTILQLGSLGLTSGNVLVYGGTAAALLLYLMLPEGNSLKPVAGLVGLGGAVAIVAIFVGFSGVH